MKNNVVVMIDGGGATINLQTNTSQTADPAGWPWAFKISGGACLCLVNLVLDGQRQNAALYAQDSGTSVLLHQVTIENCTVKDNGNAYVSSGAAVAIVSASIVATRTNFIRNSAHSVGGAIAAVGATVQCHKCQFEELAADGNRGTAGAVYLERGSVMKASETSFKRCKAGQYAGAVYAKDVSTVFNCTQCVFEGNEAIGRYGGAIYASYGAVVHLQACRIMDNRCMKYGGAAHLLHGSTLQAIDCTFERNDKAQTESLFQMYASGSLIQLTSCGFNSSQAKSVAIFATASKLQLHGKIFFASSAPPAHAIKTEISILSLLQMTNAELKLAGLAFSVAVAKHRLVNIPRKCRFSERHQNSDRQQSAMEGHAIRWPWEHYCGRGCDLI